MPRPPAGRRAPRPERGAGCRPGRRPGAGAAGARGWLGASGPGLCTCADENRMRSAPAHLHERDVIAGLAVGWGLDVASARYAPVGGGSYHWEIDDAAGRRYFATADDLDRKPWL